MTEDPKTCSRCGYQLGSTAEAMAHCETIRWSFDGTWGYPMCICPSCKNEFILDGKKLRNPLS